MVKSTVIATGEYAGGLAVVISGAESSLLMTMAQEQRIKVDEILTRLICNAGVSGVKLDRPVLVGKESR
jgi:hypothetical protein